MKTYVIAEVGINHNGSMDIAKRLILGAKESGCDAVKFQKRTVEDVYTKAALDKYRESPWGTTNRAQKEGLEFSIQQYQELFEYTKSLGLDFIVSCWDLNSVDVIEDNISVDYHKVASALATDKKFLEKLNETGKPVILSTGMCTQEQVDAAINILKNVKYVLACTSTYPTLPEEVNLNNVKTLASLYPSLSVGFSNHYNGHLACLGAIALGAECVEFHITEDRTMYGSDQASSIENYHQLLVGIRSLEKMLGDGVKRVYDTEKPIIEKLRNTDDTI